MELKKANDLPTRKSSLLTISESSIFRIKLLIRSTSFSSIKEKVNSVLITDKFL